MDVRKQLSRIGWAYVIFMVVSTLAQVAIALPLTWLYAMPSFPMDAGMMLLGSQLVMYGVGFPVFWLLMRRIPSWEMTAPKDLTAAQFLMALVLCFGMTYIGNLVGQGLMAITGALTGAENINPVMDMMEGMSLWVVALTTVIIAPVMEELMFRKFLIDRIVPLGQKTAVVLSGLSFGLFHGNFYQFFYAAALGMIFAYLYCYTGKIRYNIILHMMINIVGGVLSLALVQGMSTGHWLAEAGTSALGVFVLVTIIGALVMLVRYRKRLSWFPAWEYPEFGIVNAMLRAPGIWFYVMGCGVLFLVM